MLSSQEFSEVLQKLEPKPKVATTPRQLVFANYALMEQLIHERNYSYEELSEELAKHGLQLKPRTLRSYLSDARIADRRSRKSTRTRKRSSIAAVSKRSPAVTRIAAAPVPRSDDAPADQATTVALLPERSPAAIPPAPAQAVTLPVPVPTNPATPMPTPVPERSPATVPTVPAVPVPTPTPSAIPAPTPPTASTSLVTPPAANPPKRRPTMDELRAKYPHVFDGNDKYPDGSIKINKKMVANQDTSDRLPNSQQKSPSTEPEPKSEPESKPEQKPELEPESKQESKQEPEQEPE